MVIQIKGSLIGDLLSKASRKKKIAVAPVNINTLKIIPARLSMKIARKMQNIKYKAGRPRAFNKCGNITVVVML